MSLTLDEIVFRSRALAQTHPFTHQAQAYVNATIAREREEQPAEAMSDWASHAITVGYCLRLVEEDETDRHPKLAGGDPSPEDAQVLDDRSTQLADRIRSDDPGGLDFCFFSESMLIDALDRIIFGEIERRLSHYSEKLDPQTFEELESYIGWWTLKGYCLRVAEQLVAAEGGNSIQDGV